MRRFSGDKSRTIQVSRNSLEQVDGNLTPNRHKPETCHSLLLVLLVITWDPFKRSNNTNLIGEVPSPHQSLVCGWSWIKIAESRREEKTYRDICRTVRGNEWMQTDRFAEASCWILIRVHTCFSSIMNMKGGVDEMMTRATEQTTFPVCGCRTTEPPASCRLGRFRRRVMVNSVCVWTWKRTSGLPCIFPTLRNGFPNRERSGAAWKRSRLSWLPSCNIIRTRKCANA